MPNFDIFNYFSFSAVAVADLVFFLVTFMVAVVSLILFYHWRRYGMRGPFLLGVEFVYMFGSIVLLIIAFFSLK